MFTVKETPYFQRQAASIWSGDEKDDFIDWIAENPMAGDVVKEVGGLRKVRWSRKGMGKRSGVRVIYFNKLDDGIIVLLTVYAKSVDDALSEMFLRRLAALEGR